MSDTFEIGEEFRVFESPEKNLWACVIGVASKTVHQLPAKTKEGERQQEKRKAKLFFAGCKTSTFYDCCEALDWNPQAVKKAALTRNISVPLD